MAKKEAMTFNVQQSPPARDAMADELNQRLGIINILTVAAKEQGLLGNAVAAEARDDAISSLKARFAKYFRDDA